jgi:hypothetical protein
VELERGELPYYAAFTDPSVDAVRARVADLSIEYSQYQKFKHLALPPSVGAELISLIPGHEKLCLQAGRVSLFITPPRTYYRAHKDGFDLRFGVNYPIAIVDEKANTRFYEDQSIDSRYQVAPDGKPSREVIGFNPFVVKPACSFTMRPNELVVLNVEKYHDFHNRSDSHRVILTFRSRDLSLSFDDVVRVFLGDRVVQSA